MAGPFEIALRKFAKTAGDNADAVIRKTVLEVGARLIKRSPVDTGRFRSNWFYSFSAPSGKATEQTGVLVVQDLATMPTPAIGEIHYITNNLPYAWRLENGWSKQAPIGMVGLTALEFQSIVSEAASGLNSISVLGVAR